MAQEMQWLWICGGSLKMLWLRRCRDSGDMVAQVMSVGSGEVVEHEMSWLRICGGSEDTMAQEMCGGSGDVVAQKM